MTRFTDKEKLLAKKLKDTKLGWEPQEGDWFYSLETFSHQFYLGESLPSSFAFQAGEAYVFDSSMTWHIEQGGLNADKFVWLPTWAQCRELLKRRGFSLELHDHEGQVHLQAKNGVQTLANAAESDLEALYGILLNPV